MTMEDFELIEILDGILNEIFSYPGFSFITAGFFRIKTDFSIELYAPTAADLGRRFQKLGLKFVTVQDPESKFYSIRFFKNIKQPITFVDYIIGLIVFGHYKVAQVEGEYKALFSRPPMNTLEILFKNYRFSRQSNKYYFERRSELKEIYYSQLSKFEESLSLERILDAFYVISSIEIDTFLKDFDQYLKDIPFEVNSHTLQNFIDYYDLHWKIQGDLIINDDFKEPPQFTRIILDRLISASKQFSMIDVEQLADILGLSLIDLRDVKFLISHFKYYLNSKGVRLEIRESWVINLDKI